MIRKVILNIILLSSALVSCGCGAIHQAYEKQEIRLARLNHQDPLHINSCGPGAIEDALSSFKISMPRDEISYEIQRKNSKLRCFVSIFENDAREITWPWEIKDFFTKNDKISGFIVTEHNNLDDLSDDDVAIVLIRRPFSLRYYHWVTHPVYSKSLIKEYFGVDTKILKVYQIKRKN